MRIISQNRRISLNFDHINVNVFENCIYAKENGQTAESKGILLGRYNTHERAKKVFEDIHSDVGHFVYYMPEK